MNCFLKHNIVLRIFALIAFLWGGKASAQDVTFTATAGNTTVAAGEQFQVTYSVNGNGSKFQAPAFKDFSVLMGPSQSMSTQIINGSFSQSISYTYVLIAQREGTYEIPPASIEVNGKRLQSNSLKIVVVKGNPPQPQSQGGSSGAGGQQQASGLDSKSVFIKTFVDRSNVQIGEAITVTYKLCTKVNLVSYNISKLPSFTGFWSEDIPMQQQLQFTRQNIDGVLYSVADVKKVVIYPQRSGSLTVEPMEGEVIARVQVKRNRNPNDPFDNFFNDPFFNNSIRDVKYPIKSEPVQVTVKDLPAAPADCKFSGTVGKFNAEYSLDKKETKANEAVTLKIKFTGKGNIKLIQAPVVNLPSDIETYDPKISENITVAAGGSNGSKTFEYLLIPRKAGNYKIPLDKFCYFDVGKKNYVTIAPPELSVAVERGAESGAATVSGTSKEDVRILNKDIRFIKTGRLNTASTGRLIFLSPAFFALQSFPVAALILILFVRRKQIQQQSNIALVRSRKADRVARKRLKAAKKLLAGNEKQKFLDEMFRALWGFVSDKLRVPVSELSREKIREELTLKNISQEIISSFSETVDACEYARFAPASEDSHLEDIYNKGITVITGLYKSLK